VSWLGKIFGARSATEWREHADAAFEAKDYGTAKLSYESARDAKGATAEQRAHADARIVESRDHLARARLGEAERLAGEDNPASLDLARAEIRNALEIAASPALLELARSMAERLERTQVRTRVQELADDETELIVAISGSWEPEQADEYADYGEALTTALTDLHQDRAPQALKTLQTLLETANDPHYLHFEVARALLVTGDHEAGAARMRTFLKSIGPDEGGESRLVAHMELAGLAKLNGDFDGAVAELENAIEAMPEDPRPYLSLGVFLRKEGHASEAVEVLDAAQAVIGEAKPEWRVLQELGLAHAAANNETRGVELLESVIQMFSDQRLTDLPPDTAAPLAAIHERRGNKGRAADLYTSLARGTDSANLYRYCFAAGRLLSELGQAEDARRHLQQAVELATTDEERSAAETLLTPT